MQPLVSIICTCYNQQLFVEKTILSVLNQSYSNIELIVIDNASTDNSQEVIDKLVAENTFVKRVFNKENVGICTAFNIGVKQSSGKYLIDLSADDVLLPNRVEEQVEIFESLDKDYAVLYSDVEFIDEKGIVLSSSMRITGVSGYIFKQIVEKYIVSTPTIMIRREAFEDLGGYDETLAYEDFDFFVRASRKYKFQYINKILTQKRILSKSMSNQFYRHGNLLLASSVRICEKAYNLCENAEELAALAIRIKYFLKKCVIAQEPKLANDFVDILRKFKKIGFQTRILLLLTKIPLPWSKIHHFYLLLR